MACSTGVDTITDLTQVYVSGYPSSKYPCPGRALPGPCICTWLQLSHAYGLAEINFIDEPQH